MGEYEECIAHENRECQSANPDTRTRAKKSAGWEPWIRIPRTILALDFNPRTMFHFHGVILPAIQM